MIHLLIGILIVALVWVLTGLDWAARASLHRVGDRDRSGGSVHTWGLGCLRRGPLESSSVVASCRGRLTSRPCRTSLWRESRPFATSFGGLARRLQSECRGTRSPRWCRAAVTSIGYLGRPGSVQRSRAFDQVNWTTWPRPHPWSRRP